MISELWAPTLEDYVDLAGLLLGASPEGVRGLPRIGLAESAIHAPFASFGGQDAYEGLLTKAAVLLAHLAQNHPLPDGNKRAAFLLTGRFLTANGRSWGPQDIPRDAGTVEQIGAGQLDHDQIVAWLTERTTLDDEASA